MRHLYADFIDRVASPARYLGGEYLSAMKDPAEVDARVLLAFPDLYEIGMSHLGTKILYSLLNRDPRIWAERCYCPWTDMEAELRGARPAAGVARDRSRRSARSTWSASRCSTS